MDRLQSGAVVLYVFVQPNIKNPLENASTIIGDYVHNKTF